MSDLVVARNCCMARMASRRSRVGVGMNTGLSGRATSVKRFERSNGMDTALYKTTFTFVNCFVETSNVFSFIPELCIERVIFDDSDGYTFRCCPKYQHIN